MHVSINIFPFGKTPAVKRLSGSSSGYITVTYGEGEAVLYLTGAEAAELTGNLRALLDAEAAQQSEAA